MQHGAYGSFQQHDNTIPGKECSQFQKNGRKAVAALASFRILGVLMMIENKRPSVVMDYTGNNECPQDSELGGYKVSGW